MYRIQLTLVTGPLSRTRFIPWLNTRVKVHICICMDNTRISEKTLFLPLGFGGYLPTIDYTQIGSRTCSFCIGRSNLSANVNDSMIFCIFQRKNKRREILSNVNLLGNLTHSHDKDKFLCEYYTQWSPWTRCNRKCEQTRERKCNKHEHCGTSSLKEKRSCRRRRGTCSTLSYKVIGFRRGNRMIEELLYDLLYDGWSQWGHCTRSCKRRRVRRCKEHRICGSSYILEQKKCKIPGTHCEKRYTLKTYEPDTGNDIHDDISTKELGIHFI